MEMTVAAISCSRTHRLSSPPLLLLAQRPWAPETSLLSAAKAVCHTQAPAPCCTQCHLHAGVACATTYCGMGTGLQCLHIRGAPRSSTSRNKWHVTLCHCPQLRPVHCLSGWGRAQPSAAPGAGLELQAGLLDSAELCEGGQVHPMQPPGLAQRRFIWNEQFRNKLCNLKILRKRKRQKGGEPMAAQPVHGDRRATRRPGLSPGTGRGSVTTITSSPSPEGTWPHRPLSVLVDRPLLYPQSPAPGLPPQPAVCDPCIAAPLHSNPAAPLAP